MLRVEPRQAPEPTTSRAVAKQQIQERLIAAARTLVAERGYEAATLRDVAALAAVSTGARGSRSVPHSP